MTIFLGSVVEKKHAGQIAAERRGQQRVAMPRRAVYGNRVAIRAQHDPLVAQQPHAWMVHPQPGERGLPRPRLTGEDIGTPGVVEQGAAMHLDAPALRQQVNHQQFVEWILEGIDGVAQPAVERRPEQPHVTGGEGLIESRGLVGNRATHLRSECEYEFTSHRERRHARPLSKITSPPGSSGVSVQRAEISASARRSPVMN